MDLEDESKIFLFEVYDTNTNKQLCNKTDMSTIFDSYEGTSEKDMSLMIRTQSKNAYDEYSDIISLVFEPEFNSSLGTPERFECDLTNDTHLRWTIQVPEGIPSYGYSIDYVVSNSLNIYTADWTYAYDDTVYISETATNRNITGALDLDFSSISGKYILLRTRLNRDEYANYYPDYAYFSILKNAPYQTQIVDFDGANPCITRTYKDGQWRQCRLQYYQLHPLISEPLINEPIDETIYSINNMPIYVAKKET
jgi:hypothetical protein